jgi:hypothetical protein
VEFVVEAAYKSVLAGFHIAEKVGEMDDARHVGFVELDVALDFKCGLAHGGRWSG